MRSLALVLSTIALFTACGGTAKTSGVAQPTASASPLEVGEITVLDGEQPVLKIHADGTTELGGTRNGSPVWSPGPTIRPDGTLAANGKPGVRVADGKVVAIKNNQPLPITFADDTVTVTDGGKSIAMSIGSDNSVSFTGAGADDAAKRPHVQGADTPGKRRAVLVLMALMLGGADDHAQQSGSTPPATSP